MKRLVATLAVLLSGCGPGIDPSAPPEIRWGVDECSHCRMIIAEARYAAAGRSTDGTEARFDDLLGARELAEEPGDSWRLWVQTEAGWTPAEDAWYVRDPEEITPMGSGLLAFSERAAAERRALDAGTEALDWARFLEGSDTKPNQNS